MTVKQGTTGAAEEDPNVRHDEDGKVITEPGAATEEDAIWREIIASRKGGTDPSDEDASARGNGDDDDDDADASLAAAAAGTDADAGNRAPSDEDRANGGDASTGKSPAQASAADDDIWANVPEAARKAFEETQRRAADLEERWNRERGRTSALTRKVEEFQRGSAAGEAEGPTIPEVKEEDLKKLREQFPELGPVLDQNAALAAELNRVKATVEPVAASRTQDFVREQTQLFDSAEPKWRDIVKSQEFQAWFQDQPPEIRSLVERNANEITDAQAGERAIKLFRIDTGAAIEPPQGKGSDVGERRQRQLDSSRTTAARGPGMSSQGATTEDAIWKQAVERRRKRQAAAR